MLRDLRFAIHLIVKERWYSAVAVVALALGIGVNATVFTMVNAVLIRGLPFKDSAQLYMLGSRNRSDGDRGFGGVSYPDLRDWRAQTKAFTALAAFSATSVNVSDDRVAPEQARGTTVTANTFSLLGQQPLLGRDFVADDERRGAERVVILGYALWQSRYAGDPHVIGRSVRIDGQPATVVGVMPQGMMFPTDSALWRAYVPAPEDEKRSARFLQVFGRLRTVSTRQQAQAEMNGIAQRLAAAYPDTNKNLPIVSVQTFNERYNGGPIRVVFLSMMGAVGFVLLIACANVANLLLSRSAHRAREIAVRIALGATRWRIVRQLLIESILLGVIGGAIGLLLATVGVRLFDRAVQDVGKPYWIVFTMDYTVFGFLAAVCVLTGILFGLAPALQVSRTNVNDVLKEGGRGNAGGRRVRWMTGTMVVLELALTLVLLVGAGLMVRSFLKIYTLDLGIRTDHLMTMRMLLPEKKYPSGAANAPAGAPDPRMVFYDRLLPKIRSTPGVESAALTTSVPPMGIGTRGIEIEGRPLPAAGEQASQVSFVTINESFFETAGVHLTRGRGFRAADGTPGNETVIVNEQFVTQFFKGEDAIGRRLRLTPPQQQPGQPAPPAPVWRTVVGVAPIIRHAQPQEGSPAAVVYTPIRSDPPRGIILLVRTHLEPAALMSAVRQEVQAIDRDQPVFTIQTMDQLLAMAMWPYRVFGTLFAIFAVIALVMSAVGLYAVMAYSVTQRTPEIGVRMALGAAGRQVSWMVLKRGLLQLAIGLTLGLAGAFGLSRVLRTLLVQITPTDPVTFAAITIILAAVAIAACLLPARRATRVDPLIALRAE